MTSRTILVSDGEQRAALALVRSLGRAGHKVFTCSLRGRSIAGASRYCRAEAKIPDALTNPAAYLADLLTLVRTWRVDVLIPVTDASLLTVLSAREHFTGVCIPFPDIQTFRRVADKALVLQSAPQFGIRVPEQLSLPSPDALKTLPTQSLRFPLVLKPSRSVTENGGPRKKLTVRYAASPDQLEAQLAQFDVAAYPILLQRHLRGPGIGIFLLLWEGLLIAVFSHRRIREKPPTGGVSVYAESIAADRELVERSHGLLSRFGWQGVAMVEYKLDAAGGTPHLMEINGRFWGSLQLAVDAGVDFPRLLIEAATGEHPSAVLQYRTGVRTRWWWGDVDHLLARLRQQREESFPSIEAPSRWRAVRDFLTLWRPGDHNEVLRFSDPRPFGRETVEWFRGMKWFRE